MSITSTPSRSGAAVRPRRHRTRTRLLGTVLATTALLVPAVVGTQAASAKGKPGGGQAACTPGQLKKDSRGNTTAVCNTHGEWIKVLYLTSSGADGSVDQGAVGETAPAAPAAPTAARLEKANGTSAPTGCPLADGTQAGFGETMATVRDTRDAHGKLISRVVDSFICGADGAWHYVMSLQTQPTITQTVTVRAASTSRAVS